MRFISVGAKRTAKIHEAANTYLFMTDTKPDRMTTTNNSPFIAGVAYKARCIGLEREGNKIKFSQVEGVKDGVYKPSLGPVFNDLQPFPSSYSVNTNWSGPYISGPASKAEYATHESLAKQYCISEGSMFLSASNEEVKIYNTQNIEWKPFLFITKKAFDVSVPNPLAYLTTRPGSNSVHSEYLTNLNVGFRSANKGIGLSFIYQNADANRNSTFGSTYTEGMVGFLAGAYCISYNNKSGLSYSNTIYTHPNVIQQVSIDTIKIDADTPLQLTTNEEDSSNLVPNFLVCCYKTESDFKYQILERGTHYESPEWETHSKPEITITSGLLPEFSSGFTQELGGKGAVR